MFTQVIIRKRKNGQTYDGRKFQQTDTYVVIRSNFDSYVAILWPHKSILAIQFKTFMCLRNKSHLKSWKPSVKYSHLSIHLCVRRADGHTDINVKPQYPATIV